MALKGMSRFEVVEYVSDRDPCKRVEKVPDPADPKKVTTKTVIDEGATKFKIAPLDVFLRGHIMDKSNSVTTDPASGTAGMSIGINRMRYDTVRFGLRDWENFEDQDEGQIKFEAESTYVNGKKYQVATSQCMNALDEELLEELSQQIKDLATVKVEEAKNSEAV